MQQSQLAAVEWPNQSLLELAAVKNPLLSYSNISNCHLYNTKSTDRIPSHQQNCSFGSFMKQADRISQEAQDADLYNILFQIFISEYRFCFLFTVASRYIGLRREQQGVFRTLAYTCLHTQILFRTDPIERTLGREGLREGLKMSAHLSIYLSSSNPVNEELTLYYSHNATDLKVRAFWKDRSCLFFQGTQDPKILQ